MEKNLRLLHKHLTISSAVAETPPVVWSTPLGLPVLPEVYSRKSGSSEFIHSTCITQLHVTNARYKFDTAMLRITDIRVVHMALSCRQEAKDCPCLFKRGFVPQAREESQQLTHRQRG